MMLLSSAGKRGGEGKVIGKFCCKKMLQKEAEDFELLSDTCFLELSSNSIVTERTQNIK